MSSLSLSCEAASPVPHLALDLTPCLSKPLWYHGPPWAPLLGGLALAGPVVFPIPCRQWTEVRQRHHHHLKLVVSLPEPPVPGRHPFSSCQCPPLPLPMQRGRFQPDRCLGHRPCAGDRIVWWVWCRHAPFPLSKSNEEPAPENSVKFCDALLQGGVSRPLVVRRPTPKPKIYLGSHCNTFL